MMEHGCLAWQRKFESPRRERSAEDHPQLLADLALLPVPLSVVVRCGVSVPSWD
jgi:hypothetical protein